MRWVFPILLFAAVGYAVSPVGVVMPPGPSSSVATCAAAGCHGGGEVGRPGSEQSTWIAGDPHAKAYRVLFNDLSASIQRNLGRTIPASKDASCLACHGPNADSCQGVDGVGCDACHGPSKNWLTKHYESGWKLLDDRAKFDLGFRNTKSLVTRVAACAECHVGAPGRNVDHDLIAAGHPRLAFEYTRFHYQPGYGKHWTERMPERDFEIRAWFIGQVASLRAAIALTQWRLMQNQPHPEFSEQSCFACHQRLTGEASARHGRVPTWQPWHVALLRVLQAESEILFPGSGRPTLNHLTELEKLGMASKTNALETAKAALSEVDNWLADLQRAEASATVSPITGDHLQRLAQAVASSGRDAPGDWDVQTIHYLALAAMHHADVAALAGIREPLQRLKSSLEYAPDRTGPKDYDPERVRSEFAKIGTILSSRSAP